MFYQSFIHCIILVLYRYTRIHTPHPAFWKKNHHINTTTLIIIISQYLLCTSRKFKLFVQGCIIKLKVYKKNKVLNVHLLHPSNLPSKNQGGYKTETAVSFTLYVQYCCLVGKTNIKWLRLLLTSFFFSFLPGFTWNT